MSEEDLVAAARTRKNEKKTDGEFQIATVATLTGLDPHTIRAWERRYGAVKPNRTASGRRVYDDEAVERLQLLKALIDCGDSIGSLAAKSDETLRKRLHKLAGLAESDPRESAPMRKKGPIRLGLLAPVAAAQIRLGASKLAGVDLSVVADDLDGFMGQCTPKSCDVLVLELDALGSEPGRVMDECLAACGAQMAIVVYSFARASELARLSRRSAKLIRGPLRVESLRRAIMDLVASSDARRRKLPTARVPRASTESPARRFDDAQLAQLAETSTSIDCECPNHLSALVSALVAFETYSRNCESRDAEDAEMHAGLASGTGRARVVLEQLLEGLCEYEGIEI